MRHRGKALSFQGFPPCCLLWSRQSSHGLSEAVFAVRTWQANDKGSCRGVREDVGRMTEVAAAVLPPRIHLTSLLQPQEGKFHRRSAIQHAAGSKRPHFQGSCLLFVFSGTGTKLGFSINQGTESRVCLHACVCVFLFGLSHV